MVDDDIGEGTETFTVSIQSSSLPISRSEATVVIQLDGGESCIYIHMMQSCAVDDFYDLGLRILMV